MRTPCCAVFAKLGAEPGIPIEWAVESYSVSAAARNFYGAKAPFLRLASSAAHESEPGARARRLRQEPLWRPEHRPQGLGRLRARYLLRGVSRPPEASFGECDDGCPLAKPDRADLAEHPLGPELALNDHEKMPVRPRGKRTTVGGELRPDAAHGGEAFVDLERKHDRASLGRDENDAVGSEEAAQDIRRHRGRIPELDRRMFTISRSD